MCSTISRTLAAVVLITGTPLFAEPEKQKEPPKVDEEFAERLKQASRKMNAAQKVRDIQIQAVSNLRQIGVALFAFEKEYGGFPSDATSAALKKARGIKAELGAANANDCFLQLVAAHLMEDPKVFTFGKPDPPVDHDHEHHHHHHSVDKCSFALISVKDAAGNPMQPLAVAPLVKGKTVFDPAVFGGNAVILRLDNSVTSVPIGEDGRVMINGRDLFDPEQPFWKGDVPPIKWPAE